MRQIVWSEYHELLSFHPSQSIHGRPRIMSVMKPTHHPQAFCSTQCAKTSLFVVVHTSTDSYISISHHAGLLGADYAELWILGTNSDARGGDSAFQVPVNSYL